MLGEGLEGLVIPCTWSPRDIYRHAYRYIIYIYIWNSYEAVLSAWDARRPGTDLALFWDGSPSEQIRPLYLVTTRFSNRICLNLHSTPYIMRIACIRSTLANPSPRETQRKDVEAELQVPKHHEEQRCRTFLRAPQVRDMPLCFLGDTGYCPVFRLLGSLFRIQLAAVPIGGRVEVLNRIGRWHDFRVGTRRYVGAGFTVRLYIYIYAFNN